MMCLMKELEQFIVPYLISQAVAIGFCSLPGKVQDLLAYFFQCFSLPLQLLICI
jgi:hypothetical protein